MIGSFKEMEKLNWAVINGSMNWSVYLQIKKRAKSYLEKDIS